jgi:hypothetical protein
MSAGMVGRDFPDEPARRIFCGAVLPDHVEQIVSFFFLDLDIRIACDSKR